MEQNCPKPPGHFWEGERVMIRENIEEVERKVKDSCRKAGRISDDITLMAVSKTMPVPFLREAYEAGIRDFGENRVQELMDKIPQMPDDVRWHMIGHLQRNKVKYIIDKVAMIHSVDSLRLAEEISLEAAKRDLVVDILVEVNIAGEESKYGVTAEEASSLVEKIAKLPALRVQGLMAIAPFTENPEENRPYFQKMKKLCVDIGEKNIDNGNMTVLSMGMSGDYTVAVEEGATCIRVGTGIFGAR